MVGEYCRKNSAAYVRLEVVQQCRENLGELGASPVVLERMLREGLKDQEIDRRRRTIQQRIAEAAQPLAEEAARLSPEVPVKAAPKAASTGAKTAANWVARRVDKLAA